jgi:hypothetical protein
MQNKTLKEILASDVYEEDFIISFHGILEKFVNEYDDMAQMSAIKTAKQLLDIINDN